MVGAHRGSLVSEVTDPFFRPDGQLHLDYPAGLLEGRGEAQVKAGRPKGRDKRESCIYARPDATKRGQPNTTNTVEASMDQKPTPRAHLKHSLS